MRAFLLFAALLFVTVIHAQTIAGYVYDEAENKPLEGAYVYFDGTTFSVSTDARGFFKITTSQKYNAALVISFMGFETLRVEDPYQYSKPFKVLLREDAIALKEVVITKGGPFSRKQMLKVFREQFLGKSDSGSSCKIENEDDISLYFDTKTNVLHAHSYKPLVINNKKLQYKISFDLSDFEVAFGAKSLFDFDVRRSFFAGTTFFTDVSKNNSADKKRKAAYIGSVTHLMKAIAKDDWKSEKFQLYIDRFPANHKDYFSVKDTLAGTMVRLINVPESPVKTVGMTLKKKGEVTPSKFSTIKYVVLYDGKLQSSITFDKGYFYIDQSGLFFPLSELTFSGYMGGLKAGDLLPNNYSYTP